MALIARMRCSWSGIGVVGPGLTTFYFAAVGAGRPASVHNFFEVFKHGIPAGTTISVPDNGDLIEDTTGALGGVWSDGGGTLITSCDGAGIFAQGVGLQVRWRTAGITGHRRVVGSTFIAPILSSGFDVDGTPNGSQIAGTTGAAAALIAAQPTMRIWSRPKPPRVGSSNVVTSFTVPDRASWLRSRRT